MADATTLFSWGYKNWGNATDELVAAVDAVEASRGWGPPVFVDIRASRKVRAVGFRENAFEKRFGADRYRWYQGLGNKAILGAADSMQLIEPGAAKDLLELALQLEQKRRRVIFFCACIAPIASCHRHLVAPHVLRYAREQKRASPTVVEWPGLESEPPEPPELELSSEQWNAIRSEKTRYVPLGSSRPDLIWLSLPWYSVVRFRAPDVSGFMFTGPAQFRAGRWVLEFLGARWDIATARSTSIKARKKMLVLPRA